MFSGWFARKPYKVEVIGIMAGVRFEEGSRTMVLDSAIIRAKTAIFLDKMRWLPPHDSVPIDDDEKERIKSIIAKEMHHYLPIWVPPGCDANEVVRAAEAKAEEVRPTAEAAFREGRFDEAARLYESVGSCLSFRELGRLKRAKRRAAKAKKGERSS